MQYVPLLSLIFLKKHKTHITCILKHNTPLCAEKAISHFRLKKTCEKKAYNRKAFHRIKGRVEDLLLRQRFMFFMAHRSKSPQQTCFQNGGSCGSSELHVSAYLQWSIQLSEV